MAQTKAEKAAKQRAYYAKNRERETAKARARRGEDPKKYRAQRAARYWRDPEVSRAYLRAYYAKDPARHAAVARDFRTRFRERYAARRRYNTHGLTNDEFLEMWNLQAGRCAICEERLISASMSEGRAQTMCVDHDHETGELRGLLCSKCNRGIGLLCDAPVILRRAIEYLERRLPILA